MDFPAIDPVAFQFGPIAIRWYALAYMAGFLIGWRYAISLAYKEDTEKRPHKTDIDDFMVWAIPAVILGGRIGYILFYNLDFYIQNPFTSVDLFGNSITIPSFLALWEGGMSFHGGMLGMAVAMIGYGIKHKFNVLSLSDIISCVAPIGLFFGRIANFINGELYGRVTDVSWGVVFPHTDGAPRHPSQLYEAALEGALLFVIMYLLTKTVNWREKKGLLTGIFLFFYGLFRFLVEYVREPDEQLGLFFQYISMGQILCLPMMLAGLVFITYSLKVQNHELSK